MAGHDAGSAPDLSRIAGALADRNRSTMVLCLLDGRAWTASELAAAAGIGRSTATSHLNRLVGVGLVDEVRQGRHRYIRIADADAAATIETLAAMAARNGDVLPPSATCRAHRADARLREARSCYMHLAGGLGVRVADGLRRRGVVSDAWEMTPEGHRWFARLGIVVPEHSRRPLWRPCLDWTERREHLAGVAADAFLAHCLAHAWLTRGTPHRALDLTDIGVQQLGWVLAADE